MPCLAGALTAGSGPFPGPSPATQAAAHGGCLMAGYAWPGEKVMDGECVVIADGSAGVGQLGVCAPLHPTSSGPRWARMSRMIRQTLFLGVRGYRCGCLGIMCIAGERACPFSVCVLQPLSYMPVHTGGVDNRASIAAAAAVAANNAEKGGMAVEGSRSVWECLCRL